MRSKTTTYLTVVAALAIAVSGCARVPVSEPQPVAMPAPALTYDCKMEPLAGAPSVGEGPYGCYFYLIDPEEGKIRSNTSYLLEVYPPLAKPSDRRQEPIVGLKGVTDAQGRSVFVRAPFPIQPDLVRFVEVIGTGPYSGSSRMIRGSDGDGVPGIMFRYTSCSGQHVGLTDEQGYTPLFASDRSCEFNVKFIACKQAACTAQDVRAARSKLKQAAGVSEEKPVVDKRPPTTRRAQS